MSTPSNLCRCGRRKKITAPQCGPCNLRESCRTTAPRASRDCARAFNNCPERQARIAMYRERAGRGEELFQGERS